MYFDAVVLGLKTYMIKSYICHKVFTSREKGYSKMVFDSKTQDEIFYQYNTLSKRYSILHITFYDEIPLLFLR